MLRIWDCLFNEGSKIIFRVALTLIKQHQAFILEATSVADISERFKEITRGSFVTECHTFMQVSVSPRVSQSACPCALWASASVGSSALPDPPPPRAPAGPQAPWRAPGRLGPRRVCPGSPGRSTNPPEPPSCLEPFPCCRHLWFQMALLGPSGVARVCFLSYPRPGTGVYTSQIC